MKFKLYSVLLLLLSSQVYAVLNKPFDLTEYNRCQQALAACPRAGVVAGATCVKRVVKKNNTCRQVAKLATKLDVLPSMIFVKRLQSVFVLNQASLADGQDHYYLLFDGKLLNTLVDPRQLDKALAKAYQGKDWLLVSWGEPLSRTKADGSYVISTLLKITDTCLACEVVGWAMVDFSFAANNVYTGVVLQRFVKQTRTG